MEFEETSPETDVPAEGCHHQWSVTATQNYTLPGDNYMMRHTQDRTRVLSVCVRCGEHRVFSIEGTWQTQDFQIAEEAA